VRGWEKVDPRIASASIGLRIVPSTETGYNARIKSCGFGIPELPTGSPELGRKPMSGRRLGERSSGPDSLSAAATKRAAKSLGPTPYFSLGERFEPRTRVRVPSGNGPMAAK
jgi:hypothetical protein